MPNQKAPLKQADIAKLFCPPTRKSLEYTVDAIKVPGLFVEVRHTGGMTYTLRHRDANNCTRYSKIGRVTDISLADAKKQALKLRAGILLGNHPGADKREQRQCMTFSEFFEQKYLPFARPRKRSWRDDEKLYTRRLRSLYGSTPIGKITRHSLQQMHSDLRSELSASSCDHHLGLMSRCLRLALDWKLITENPAQGLKKYNEDNRRDRLMTDDELQRLMGALDSDPARTACLALKMALYTTARKGEILHMKWADINRQTNVWSLPASETKGKRRRAIPMSSSALSILDELAQNNNSEFVFENSRKPGDRLKSIDKIWARVKKTANLPNDVSPHLLRHQGATMMLASGTDLETVRSLLGHANISTTQIYLHASGESLRGGTASIETYLEKALANKAS